MGKKYGQKDGIQKQSFLEGAMVLMLGTIIVKFVSMLFKMPIGNLLGGTGYAYFNNAYVIFNLLSTIATAGLPIAIAKMVSESNAAGRYNDTRKILRLSRKLFWLTGLACMVIMMIGAGFFAQCLESEGSKIAITCLSPAVLTCCLMSSYRGYYQGMKNMIPTSMSQIVESVAKLIFGLLFTWCAMGKVTSELNTYGTVLGVKYETEAQSQLAVYQIAAGAAVLGVVVSTAAGALYLWLRHRIKGDGITKEMLQEAPEPALGKHIAISIITLGIPICLGSLATSIGGIIDVATIQKRIMHVMLTNPQPLLESYGSLIAQSVVETNTVHIQLAGVYSNIAENLSNIVTAVTAGFAVSALPAVASAWASKNKHHIQRNIETILRVTTLICIPAGLGLSALAQPVASLFYGSRPDDVAIAAPLLSVLGVASIFIALTGTINSILQAVGRVTAPVKLILIGVAIKFTINFIGIGIPSINIKAVPWATLSCYLVIVVLGLYLVEQSTGISYHYGSILLKPTAAGVCCAVAARQSYLLLYRLLPSKLTVLPAVAIGGIVYVLVIFLVKAITRDDILMLPKGEKLAEILEKYSLLG